MSDVSFYPPAPVSGDNAFGKFAFGVSSFGAFGDLPVFNWLLTVISEYANSPTILSLLQSFNDALNQTQNFDNFYDYIWNVATAQGIGLDIWGRIVGVNRNLQVTDGTWFGFSQGVPGTDVFGPGGMSPFYSGEPLTSNFALTDQAYRQLILAKAAYNICNGSVPAINAILMRLFGPGNAFGVGGDCYCTDDGGMTMTYTFKFEPNPVEQSIILNSGVLPKPVGVAASVVIAP
jgi:hypothetical protein